MRTAELPSNGWGDAAFHLAQAARALEAAAHEAVSRDERMLATRMRVGVQRVHRHTLARAVERADQQEAVWP